MSFMSSRSRTNRFMSILSIFSLVAPATCVWKKGDDAGGDDGAGGGGGGGNKSKAKPPVKNKADDDDEGEEDGDEGEEDDEDEDDEDDENEEGDPVSRRDYNAVHKESTRRKHENTKLKKELAKLKGNRPTDEELEEYREYRANKQKEETENKKKKGQFDEILRDKENKHKDELRQKDEQIAVNDRRWRSEKVTNFISLALPKYTEVPVTDIAPLIANRFKCDDEGNIVLDFGDEDVPTNPETGDEFTPEEWIADWVSKRPHFAAHKPKGGSGSGANGKPGKSKDLSAKDIDQMSDEEYEKHRESILRGVKGSGARN